MKKLYKGIEIKRGHGIAGVYYYVELPDGSRVVSAYEGALSEYIDTHIEKGD